MQAVLPCAWDEDTNRSGRRTWAIHGDNRSGHKFPFNINITQHIVIGKNIYYNITIYYMFYYISGLTDNRDSHVPGALIGLCAVWKGLFAGLTLR